MKLSSGKEERDKQRFQKLAGSSMRLMRHESQNPFETVIINSYFATIQGQRAERYCFKMSSSVTFFFGGQLNISENMQLAN